MIVKHPDCRFNFTRRDYLYLILVISLLIITAPADCNAQSTIIATYLTGGISTSLLHLILTLLGALIIICLLIIYFSLKLKRLNSELVESNKNILEVNSDLQKANRELALQKELITKEHFESDEFFRILIQAAYDGISFYDREKKLKYANPAFYSIIGVDKSSYDKLDHLTLLHPEDHDYQLKKEKDLMQNGSYESEIRLLHTDGHWVNVSTRSVIIRSQEGEELGSLTISRDITRFKEVLEELITANIERESGSRLKATFLANISHEIRTPLNSVVGFANLLLSEDLTKEMKEDYIEHINYNSEKLLQIIGDIIDLSRLSSSQIEITYEESSISQIVNEIIDDARQIIRRNDKPIILSVKDQLGDSSDLIFTDRIWLKRVLGHLMDNAIKFTLDGSIELMYQRENEHVVFRVKDTGIGINKENLGRIFEEFRQEVDGNQRPFEGLGVGLTLAKEVVKIMGGKIDVKSEKGIGSEFSFSIPYRPAGGSKTQIRQASDDLISRPINWSNRKCLLVDDNKDVLLYLKRILLDTGIRIVTARSGIEAIEIVKTDSRIDLIILDMQMPEMNGIDATREIKKIRKNLPIIAQTAFVYENDTDIILEAGCDACLIKPIRREHLLTVMSSFVKAD